MPARTAASSRTRRTAALLWRVGIAAADADAAAAAMAALDGVLETVSAFELSPGGAWQVEGLSREPPDRALIETRLALAWAAQRDPAPAPVIERVPARDWLAENQASFPPIAVGRFFVHGGHERRRPPSGRVALLIDAATAFGTGEHATTRGVLLALEGLARRGRRRRVLDMGTGTGILAIAAAKCWRRKVWARDIEGEAVRVARHNARRNGVAALLALRRSDGYRDRGLRRAAPFDLVLANILARPLMLMARELSLSLGVGGVAVLSGLLARQEAAVLAAHRRHGLHLFRRIACDGWHTLVLTRGRRLPTSSVPSLQRERP